MKTCGHVRNKLVSLNHCPLITFVALLRRDTSWQSAKWVWYFWWCVLKSVFFCLKYIKIIYIYFCYHHIASIWYGATPQPLGFNFGLATGVQFRFSRDTLSQSFISYSKTWISVWMEIVKKFLCQDIYIVNRFNGAFVRVCFSGQSCSWKCVSCTRITSRFYMIMCMQKNEAWFVVWKIKGRFSW